MAHLAELLGPAVTTLFQTATSGKDPQGRPAKGTLVPGAAADLHVLNTASAIDLAYRPGMPLTWQTWVAGKKVFG